MPGALFAVDYESASFKRAGHWTIDPQTVFVSRVAVDPVETTIVPGERPVPIFHSEVAHHVLPTLDRMLIPGPQPSSL